MQSPTAWKVAERCLGYVAGNPPGMERANDQADGPNYGNGKLRACLAGFMFVAQNKDAAGVSLTDCITQRGQLARVQFPRRKLRQIWRSDYPPPQSTVFQGTRLMLANLLPHLVNDVDRLGRQRPRYGVNPIQVEDGASVGDDDHFARDSRVAHARSARTSSSVSG